MKKIYLILSVLFIVACHDDTEDVYEPPRVFIGIKVLNSPEKTDFLLGETINFDNLKVVEVYADGYEKETTNYKLQWSGNQFKAGANILSVTARGKYVSYDIIVQKKLMDTGLPVVYIDIDHDLGIFSKTNYINAKMTITDQEKTLYSGSIGIRGRGHATWTYPKKPYRVKLDSKADLLGMGSDRNWALMPNYCDKTLMRTSVAFKVSELLDFPWTPKSRFVELVLNGEYVGNYMLVEAVRPDKNRVDIPDTGFIIERDGYFQEDPVWFTTPRFGFSFKNPDAEDLSAEQLNYIRDYMNEFENVLYSEAFKDPDKGYANYINSVSFARWFLCNMILANIDTNPYIVKEDMTDQSKLSMGPVWDFEWSMGIGWYYGSRPRPADYFVVYTDFYFYRLMQDARFASTVKRMWSTNQARIYQEVLQHFANVQNEIMRSQELNFKRWDIQNVIVSVGGIPMGGFEKEVACDRQFFINRMSWLDDVLNQF